MRKTIIFSSIFLALFFVFQTPAFAATEFAPHDLTSNTSHSPFVTRASSYADSAYRAFYALSPYTGYYWLNSQYASFPHWWQLDTGVGNAYILESYEIKTTAGGQDSAPKAWLLQGSNDDFTWDTLDTVSDQTSWSSGEKRSFTCDTQTTAYRIFRIYITESNHATYVHLEQVYLYGTAGTPTEQEFFTHNFTSDTSNPPLVSSVSSRYNAATAAFCVFNGYAGATDYWIGKNGGTDWVKIDLGEGNSKILKRYGIRVNVVPEPDRAPKNWTMEGSNDDSSWDTLDTVANETSWGSGEARAFTCDVQTTSYRYFRLNITANNGNVTYTQIMDLYLISSTGSGEAPARVIRLLKNTRLLGGVRLQ